MLIAIFIVLILILIALVLIYMRIGNVVPTIVNAVNVFKPGAMRVVRK